MNLMIASDLHGSAYYGRLLLEAFEREQPQRLLLLGDLLYHGPRNDLPRDYDPKQVIALLNSIKEHLLWASAETATATWIRWSWNFPLWLSHVYSMCRTT